MARESPRLTRSARLSTPQKGLPRWLLGDGGPCKHFSSPIIVAKGLYTILSQIVDLSLLFDPVPGIIILAHKHFEESLSAQAWLKMGVEPPFIYDRPNAWNFAGPTDRSFNPKAATQASWTPKTPTTPKKDGPLVDFNKHPDSVSNAFRMRTDNADSSLVSNCPLRKPHYQAHAP